MGEKLRSADGVTFAPGEPFQRAICRCNRIRLGDLQIAGKGSENLPAAQQPNKDHPQS